MGVDFISIVAVRFKGTGYSALCTLPTGVYLNKDDCVDVVVDNAHEDAVCLSEPQIINTDAFDAIKTAVMPRQIGRIVGRYLYESYEQTDKDNADKGNTDKEVDAIDA